MNADSFVKELSKISIDGVFNPYKDVCEKYDHCESPLIRCLNLQRYLESATNPGVDSVWIGRDCGYRGGRRTGIALTDELNIEALDLRFGISGLAKATIGQPVKERTASEVWKSMRNIDARVFLWNIFPFHPFEVGNPMSNRRHSAREFNECKEFLFCLLEWLQPNLIVAIGADAHRALHRLDFQVSPVRHPSYGGHLEFASGIRQLYNS